MKSPERERRDWSLLIFIVPIGILLMVLVGQLAIRILPFWTVDTGMGSKLDPDTEPHRPFSIFQPLLPQILTPMSWAGTYLTPSGDISFPPFFVFEPGASNSPTPVSPTQTVPTPIGTATSATPVGSVSPPPVGSTTKPPNPVPTTATTPPTEEPTQPPTDEPTQPPTDEPTQPPTDEPTQPPTDEPTQPPTDEPTEEPTEPPPVPTGYPSMPPSGYSPITPPGGIVIGPPDGNIGSFGPNQYIIIDLGSNPVIVDGNNYDWDMVYYEKMDGSTVFIDNVIVGISMNASGSPYYIVFNWGDISGTSTNDTNTSLAGIIEVENAVVSANSSNFYNPPSAGIAINVDGAASQPPPGSYRYVIVLAQIGTTQSSDWLEMDSILILP